MDDGFRRWLLDPVMGRLIASAVALLAVCVVAGLGRRVLWRYMPGPEAQYGRIQLAGIRGDVIDVGILRTTLMEASWDEIRIPIE